MSYTPAQRRYVEWLRRWFPETWRYLLPKPYHIVRPGELYRWRYADVPEPPAIDTTAHGV
jgi:hypothetical protein